MKRRASILTAEASQNKRNRPSSPTKLNATLAASRTTGFARNATDNPASAIIFRSFEPSPIAMARCGSMPSVAHVSRSVRAFTSALTISPITFPVSLPSTISSVFARVKSRPRRAFSFSVKNVKPPETSSVFKPGRSRAREHAFRARRQLQPFLINAFQRARIEPFQQRDAARQAFVEVLDLAAHRRFGDRRDFRLQPAKVRNFIDAFDRDQRRIHVHRDEAEIREARAGATNA